MVQNANLHASKTRSAKAALALALVFVWISPLALLSCPEARAQSGDAKAISSAVPGAVAPYLSDDGQPVTRVSRPHRANGSNSPNSPNSSNFPSSANPASSSTGGGDIKLQPMQPVLDPVTPKAAKSTDPSATGSSAMPTTAPSKRPVAPGADGGDPYPTIGRLEGLTLGAAQPSVPITDRLARLETAVFKKVYADDSLFDRTDRLKNTLLGPDMLDPNSAAARDHDDLVPLGRPAPGLMGPGIGGLGLGVLDPTMGADPSTSVSYLDELAAKPDNQQAAPVNVLNQFALELINYERRNAGIGPLVADEVADRVAANHIQELAARSVISHFSSRGENPDRRYSLAGGSDAMVESVASIKTAEVGSTKLSKAALAKLIKSLLGRQDDRDALMSPDASQLGFALALSADKSKLLSAFEVISRHGVIDKVPLEVSVGDKLEVKGTMESPYVFDRITVAWEANNIGSNASSADESEDALPYFPPLDYVAYAGHSDHDYRKTILALKTIGVVAAIAGGVFIPPVALAAPLIIMSGGGPGSEPRPVSDIPIKSGVKVEGASFDAKIPISNSNKEGLYYITIYGSLGSHSQQSVVLSRRVIVAHAFGKAETVPAGSAVTKYDDEVTGKVEPINSDANGNSPTTDIKSGTAGSGKKKNSRHASHKSAATKSDTVKVPEVPSIFTPESNPAAGAGSIAAPKAGLNAAPNAGDATPPAPSAQGTTDAASKK